MPGLARGAACAAAGLALLTGCSEESSDPFASSGSSISVVAVDPQYFLGDVPCAGNDGAMRSYVATVTDRSIAETFVLPSSPPVSCADRVLFRYVISGHEYSAEIDAYEQAPEDLAPFAGDSSGSRRMHLVQGGDEVTPRWTTACGENRERDPEGAAIAGKRNDIRGCDPLEDHVGIGDTTITVDPRLALGELTCGDGAGQVKSFDVTPEPPLVSYVNVPCDAVVPFVYDAGIEPGRTYTFRIEADVAGEAEMPGEPHGARCQATAALGLRINASCTPLSSVGALTIPLGSILTDAVAGCQAKVELSKGIAPDTVVVSSLAPVPCDETLSASLLAPGAYRAEINVLAPMQGDKKLCAGEVYPGETTVCDPVSVAPQ